MSVEANQCLRTSQGELLMLYAGVYPIGHLKLIMGDLLSINTLVKQFRQPNLGCNWDSLIQLNDLFVVCAYPVRLLR
jgi:hypothetical protein